MSANWDSCSRRTIRCGSRRTSRLLDQMSQGRAYAGFVRGIQERWLNTFGQHYSPALADNVTDRDAHMRARAELFAEDYAIIRKALASDTFSYQGKFWQIPAPRLKWTGAKVTRESGKGVDADGQLREVGIAPRYYNNRTPTFFEPFAISTQQGEEAAARGSVPIIISIDPPIVQKYLRMIQEGWARGGRTTQPGEGAGIIRYVLVADSMPPRMSLPPITCSNGSTGFQIGDSTPCLRARAKTRPASRSAPRA
jgi:alkanesulfonate monooxygenase SsuD/methylene tetrahydromethanopterin reductase-like flavin-dependent oxidoreductase (luciferase family)